MVLASATPINIPIDLARDVKQRLSLKAEEGVTRVVLFHRMDRMLAASADALLKLIEEPPANTVIIMTSERPEALLPTIESRSRKIRLARIPEAFITGYLIARYAQTNQKSKLQARLSDGILGRAVEMASWSEDDGEMSNRAVGLLLFKSLFHDSSPVAVSRLVELVGNDRSEAERLLALWQSLVRDSAHYAISAQTDELVNVDFTEELVTCSRRFADPQLAPAMVGAIKNSLADLRLNAHIQLSLAALTLKLGAALRASGQPA